MNHRRHKAMRFVKLSWITKEPRRALVFYLINTPLPKSRFLACISSRITTVIQVVRYYQINDNWFNEPFAVSLYRLLILRHAWLNLWDKHMTTGRINQVTILRPRLTHKWENHRSYPMPKQRVEVLLGWLHHREDDEQRRISKTAWPRGELAVSFTPHPVASSEFLQALSAMEHQHS